MSIYVLDDFMSVANTDKNYKYYTKRHNDKHT